MVYISFNIISVEGFSLEFIEMILCHHFVIPEKIHWQTGRSHILIFHLFIRYVWIYLFRLSTETVFISFEIFCYGRKYFLSTIRRDLIHIFRLLIFLYQWVNKNINLQYAFQLLIYTWYILFYLSYGRNETISFWSCFSGQKMAALAVAVKYYKIMNKITFGFKLKYLNHYKNYKKLSQRLSLLLVSSFGLFSRCLLEFYLNNAPTFVVHIVRRFTSTLIFMLALRQILYHAVC